MAERLLDMVRSRRTKIAAEENTRLVLARGTPEHRRLLMENEQLKLALAEATVQLRIWQRGAALADQVPSPTSKP
jgi:hypothetical protein